MFAPALNSSGSPKVKFSKNVSLPKMDLKKSTADSKGLLKLSNFEQPLALTAECSLPRIKGANGRTDRRCTFQPYGLCEPERKENELKTSRNCNVEKLKTETDTEPLKSSHLQTKNFNIKKTSGSIVSTRYGTEQSSFEKEFIKTLLNTGKATELSEENTSIQGQEKSCSRRSPRVNGHCLIAPSKRVPFSLDSKRKKSVPKLQISTCRDNLFDLDLSEIADDEVPESPFLAPKNKDNFGVLLEW